MVSWYEQLIRSTDMRFDENFSYDFIAHFDFISCKVRIHMLPVTVLLSLHLQSLGMVSALENFYYSFKKVHYEEFRDKQQLCTLF